MKNLITRTLTGIVYSSVIIASLLIHPLLFIALSSFFALMALIEMQKLQHADNIPAYWYAVVIIALAGSLISAYNTSDTELSVALLIIMLIIIQAGILLFTKEDDRRALFSMGFSILYIVVPIYLLNYIHLQSFRKEIPFALIIFFLIWINDTFAYLTGMLTGKHKLFEKISPAKTWEGFFGGILFTLAATYLLHRYYDSMSLMNWLLFGALVSLSAVVGDLFESMLKRQAGVKDSGKLLPGHGGMLDRIDSMLMAAPVVFVYLIFIK